MKIGYRIKDLRTRQRVTLKGLAEKTELTTSFLSQIERDLVSPSVRSLEKIAQALNTKVGHFFEREETKELIFIKKATDKQVLDDEEKGIFCETLASGILNIKMQPHVFTLGKGAELTKELIYSDGEKFGMVLKGKMELQCDLEKFTLEDGDSIYCAYIKRLHRVINVGETEAKLLWIVFVPA